MSFIRYDKKRKEFIATKKRPNNQSDYEVLKKVAKRLTDYTIDHPDTELTQLQSKFVEQLHEEKTHFRLSDYQIHMAHRVAISKIIEFFVNILNDPSSFKLTDANRFVDEALSSSSSQSSSSSINRSTLRAFFEDVRDGVCPNDLCDRVNKIIKRLNRCSKNLIPGHARVNCAVGNADDPHFVRKKGAPGFFMETAPSKHIVDAFKKLPGGEDYRPKTKILDNGASALLSSSIFSRKEKAYVVPRSDATFKHVP